MKSSEDRTLATLALVITVWTMHRYSWLHGERVGKRYQNGIKDIKASQWLNR
jgi:hypothetical protein